MKKFRTFILGTLITLTSLFSISNVMAVSKKVNFHFSTGNVKYEGGYKFINYFGWFSSDSNIRSNHFKLFCVDPGRTVPLHGIGAYELEEIEFTGDPNSISEAKYYGLAAILKNGTSNPYDSSWKIRNTDMAVRAYSLFVLGNGPASEQVISYNSDGGRIGNGLLAIAHQVAEESAYYNDLKDKLHLDFNKGKDYKNIYSNVEEVKNLLRKAYQAAIDYRNGDVGGTAKIDVAVTSSDYNKETNERTVQEKVINFKITQSKANFGYVKIKRSDVVCNDCATYGLSIAKVDYLDNGEWKTLTDNEIDLAKFVDKNGNAKIKITINKTFVDVEDCGHSITINYRVPAIKETTVRIVVMNRSPRDGYQRFVGGTSNNLLGGDSNGNGGEDEFVETTKTYTIPADSVECLPIPCDSELETPICSDTENGKATVKAPTNIKRCIINNADDAGNSYKLNKNNKGVDNAYCSTFCKEDYREISLNRAISDLNCGGYFQLRARIEGSQDCYRATITGDKSIDKTRFVDDIVEAQRSIINEYNKYLRATDAKTKPVTAENNIVGTYNGIEVDEVKSDGTITTKNVTLSYEYRGNNAEEVKKAIDNDLESAKKNLDQKNYSDDTAYGRYLNIINSLNACTVTWDNTYKFAQKVTWEYNEYINGTLQDTYYGLVAEKDRYLNPIESTFKTSTTIQACTGTIDNEYNLCNGSVNNWQNVDSVFSNYNFTVCSIDGCTTNTQRISNAKYVKQHIEAEQDYETPSVFYQIAGSGPASGGITTNNTYTGPSVQLTPVEGLPLSLDSVGGGIFKLSIQNLGEFYDTGELGRLIDFGGKNENHSVAKTQNKTDVSKWNGDYKCYYENNCKPKDCPTCDFVCEGDYCEWVECPTCTTECVNCIYNLGELQLNFKPVSTSKFDSAGREYGYNWKVQEETGTILDLVSEKAKETIDRIEESNTTIYDDNETDNSNLEFSIKLTPDVTKKIRDYNNSDKAEGKGGYNNQTLTCYDYEDENNAVHKNVFCYSNFIDYLIDDVGADVYAKNRGEISNRTAESALNSGYWEPWAGYEYKESVVGGPSWK